MFDRVSHPAPLYGRLASRDSFNILEKVMKVLGSLPPDDVTLHSQYFSWTLGAMMFGAGYMIFGIGFSIVINQTYSTPSEFIKLMMLFINSVVCFTKFCVTLSARHRFYNIYDILDLSDKRVDKIEDRAVLSYGISQALFACKIFLTFYNGFTFFNMISSILNQHPPYGLYIPFVDWHDGPGSLWIAYIIELLISMITVQFAFINDTAPMVMIVILRCHFKILINRVNRLRSDVENSEEDNYEELNQCILDHKRILNCCAILRPSLSRTVFLQYLIIGVSLGLSAVNILMLLELAESVVLVVLCICLIMQVSPLSYICDFLAEDSNTLADAIFHSNWIDADKRYKLSILYFLHSAQKPVTFTAGGIFRIGIETNFRVTKLALSVVTVAKAIMGSGKS